MWVMMGGNTPRVVAVMQKAGRLGEVVVEGKEAVGEVGGGGRGAAALLDLTAKKWCYLW